MAETSPDRILFLLKTRGPSAAAALAHALGITAMGARQHLARLAEQGLVAHADERRSVGRPKRSWRLTETAQARFPDGHAQMTVELLDGLRRLFGEDGLDRLISLREGETLARYRQELAGVRSLRGRLRRLAGLRSTEGYMADAVADSSGAWLLIENHCPVCAAARACQGLCRSELAVFQALLPDCRIERIDHVLAGARRCAYRIVPAGRLASGAANG